MKVGHASLSPWRGKSLPVRDAVLQALADFDGSMSVRQLYYQVVTQGAVSNCEESYAKVQRIVLRMRRLGEIPWGRIVDRGRTRYQASCWGGIGDIMEAVASQYRRDLWVDQPTIPMIGLEKHALEGVFQEAVDDYAVSLWTLGGTSSASFLFDWSEEIQRLNAKGKCVVIAYFGDHDPAGLDIARAARDGLVEHGAHGFAFLWEGLHLADLDTFNVPALRVKRTDKRSARYLETHGDRCAELDALPPAELRRRIHGFIEGHVDHDALDRVRRVEAEEKATLTAYAKGWAS
jgi:hypothetical protein